MTESDLAHLRALNRLLSVVRDRVRGVARGYYPALLLGGRAGTGKTYTVRRTLAGIDRPSEYHAGHITPMGLFDLIHDFPDHVIVLDDVAQLLASDTALQLLLAALGVQVHGDMARVVKYRRQGRDVKAVFRGGIILITNIELRSGPLADALRSRAHYLRYDPSEEQVAALMQRIAASGRNAPAPIMTPQEGEQVAEFVIAECRRVGLRLDLRLLVDKAYQDFVQHRDGAAETHWQDLIAATIQERLLELRQPRSERPLTRAQRLEEDRRIVAEIVTGASDSAEQHAAWLRMTGMSVRTYQRRRREMG